MTFAFAQMPPIAANCTGTKRALSGGVKVVPTALANQTVVRATYPNATGNGWIALVATTADPTQFLGATVSVFVICATVQ